MGVFPFKSGIKYTICAFSMLVFQPRASHMLSMQSTSPTTAPVATVLFYAFLIMLPFYLISEHLSCYVGQTELARPTLEQDKDF